MRCRAVGAILVAGLLVGIGSGCANDGVVREGVSVTSPPLLANVVSIPPGLRDTYEPAAWRCLAKPVQSRSIDVCVLGWRLRADAPRVPRVGER